MRRATGLVVMILAVMSAGCGGGGDNAEPPSKANWKNASVGDELKYRMGNSVQTWVVESVDDKEVVIRVKETGRRITKPSFAPHMYAPSEMPPLMGEPEPESTETVSAAGEDFTCEVWTMEGTENGQDVVVKNWICPEVPGGLVKATWNGNPYVTLLELKKN